MGFALVGGQTIFLFTIVIAVVSLIYLQSQDSFVQYTADQEKISLTKNTKHSAIEFAELSFDNSTNTTTIRLTNTGGTQLDLDQIDVYFQDNRIERNVAVISRSIAVDNSNQNVVDQGDVVLIQIQQNLTPSTYDYTIAPEFGKTISQQLEVS